VLDEKLSPTAIEILSDRFICSAEYSRPDRCGDGTLLNGTGTRVVLFPDEE
jgi:hypothetical protein